MFAYSQYFSFVHLFYHDFFALFSFVHLTRFGSSLVGDTLTFHILVDSSLVLVRLSMFWCSSLNLCRSMALLCSSIFDCLTLTYLCLCSSQFLLFRFDLCFLLCLSVLYIWKLLLFLSIFWIHFGSLLVRMKIFRIVGLLYCYVFSYPTLRSLIFTVLSLMGLHLWHMPPVQSICSPYIRWV